MTSNAPSLSLHMVQQPAVYSAASDRIRFLSSDQNFDKIIVLLRMLQSRIMMPTGEFEKEKEMFFWEMNSMTDKILDYLSAEIKKERLKIFTELMNQRNLNRTN